MVSENAFRIDFKTEKKIFFCWIQNADFNLARDGSKWELHDKLSVAQKDWTIFFNTLYLKMIPKLDWLELSEMNGDNVWQLKRNCTAFVARLLKDSVGPDSSRNENYCPQFILIIWIFSEIDQPAQV